MYLLNFTQQYFDTENHPHKPSNNNNNTSTSFVPCPPSFNFL